MSESLTTLSWSETRLGEAFEALAAATGGRERGAPLAQPPPTADGDEAIFARWVGEAARPAGLEPESVHVAHAEAERLIRTAGPALLRISVGGETRYLVLLRPGRRSVPVLAPGLGVRRAAVHEVRAALCRPLEEVSEAGVEALLETAGVPAARLRRARTRVLRERLATSTVSGCWLLRPRVDGPLWPQLRRSGVFRDLVGMSLSYLVRCLLVLGSWWLIGRQILAGRVDPAWLLGWALLLLTMVPAHLLTVWLQGRLFVATGALLKRRLLAGLARQEPEEVRRCGTGQLLGQVLESEAVEAMVLAGGYATVLAAIELVLAGLVLTAGAGGALHGALLLAWVVMAGGLVVAVYRARDRWTGDRLRLTHDTVEKMVGHRTRLAQQAPPMWHWEEDQLLRVYLGTGQRMDALGPLAALLDRGWYVVGVAGVAGAFVWGQASTASLAVALGGVLIAGQALSRLAAGLDSVASAVIAWRRVAHIHRAAGASRRPGGSPFPDVGKPLASRQDPLIEMRDVVFRHAGRADPVLDHVEFEIEVGDRVLLIGPSGSGKTTLASVLAGIREPESGLVLQRGLDLQTVGGRVWREEVAAAPQFNDNHVLTETLGFNLLMGRRWPPSRADLDEAEQVCRELGLGDLLDRMPAGLLQVVGDSGWQLSHGERSRLYVARALLQGASLVILDESMAALDPDSLEQAAACVLRRAPALVLIAHP